MTTKTRAEQTVEMLRTRMPVAPAPEVREITQPDTAGMDKLTKRRTALEKLAHFKDGVL
jgi:hypothetical protein